MSRNNVLDVTVPVCLVLALVVPGFVGCGRVMGPTRDLDAGEIPAEPDAGPIDTGDTGTSGEIDRPPSMEDVVDDSSHEPDVGAPSRPSCIGERTIADRPDDSPLDQVRVLYVLPSDRPDEALDTDGRICSAISSIDRWLIAETGGPRLRWDTAAGGLDVGFVRLTESDEVLRGTSAGGNLETGFAYLRDRIELALRGLGLLAGHKLYAVYYGGSSPFSCGGGAWPPSLRGQVAALYLKGEPRQAPPCSSNPLGASPSNPGYLEYAMLHELFHTLGLVARGAAHEHAAGHAFDVAVAPEMAARDLMYAPRTGADPFWGPASAGLILDIGHDDYYLHGRAGLPDLARSSFLDPLPAEAQRPPGW